MAVRLWVAGESLRAALEHVIVAAYRCRDDWQDRKVKDIHGGVFYPTRVASPQGTLIPLTPQESLVAKRVTTSWVIAAFNTDGEVIFAAVSMLTHQVVNGPPDMNCAYVRLRQQ